MLEHPGELLTFPDERPLALCLLWLNEDLPALGVIALPIGALDLDPVTAHPARVARVPELGNDALETELVAVVEQDLAIGKRLDLLEEWRLRLSAQPPEVAFALRE